MRVAIQESVWSNETSGRLELSSLFHSGKTSETWMSFVWVWVWSFCDLIRHLICFSHCIFRISICYHVARISNCSSRPSLHVLLTRCSAIYNKVFFPPILGNKLRDFTMATSPGFFIFYFAIGLPECWDHGYAPPYLAYDSFLWLCPK